MLNRLLLLCVLLARFALAAAPTLISYTEVSWAGTGTSRASASISWQSGDVIAVIAGIEGGDTLGVPTATGLTFASQKSNTAPNTCGSQLATAVAGSSGSGAVTVSSSSGANHWGFGVWVFRNSAGVGNSSEQHTTTKTVSLTPTAADGAIVYAVFDFNADVITGRSLTPAVTNSRQAAQDSGHYTYLVGDLADQTSAGAVSYGLSGGSNTGPFSVVVMEIKAGAGGGGGATPGINKRTKLDKFGVGE